MATSNFSLVRSLSLTFFLVLLTKVNSTNTVSFTFNKFKPNQPNLMLQGDALVTSSGKLQLTKVDKTGTPESYSTWSRTLRCPNPHLGQQNRQRCQLRLIPKTGAGLLGLFDSASYNKSYQTVAVEFDTYCNGYYNDPPNTHIGIDVNSIKSIKTTSWGFANGQVAKVLVTFDASTKLLVASLIHPTKTTSFILSDVVDLKSVLPEWVSIGFSAATGASQGYTETHDVLSWSFASKLSDGSSSSDALDLASILLHEVI
ncbi:Seed lectin beta chain [Spatholobus suberectus]|nr:Seed lectin beta chain [Spatholobus suberectus]